MKHPASTRLLLSLAAALLLPAACRPTPPERPADLPLLLMEPEPWIDGDYSRHYEPAEAAFCRALHDACRRCAFVEFAPGGRREKAVRYTRQQVEPALQRILGINDWYCFEVLCRGKRQQGSRSASRAEQPCIRFLDAEGKDILALADYPCGPGYTPHQRAYMGYLSLWMLFWHDIEAPFLSGDSSTILCL